MSESDPSQFCWMHLKALGKCGCEFEIIEGEINE